MALVQAHVTMMGRIEAGERLAAINDRAIAAGNLQPGDAGRILRRLEDQARGARSRVAKATPGMLAGMGIGMVSVPPTPPLSPAETVVSDD